MVTGAIEAAEDVQHAVGRRLEAHGEARGRAGAGNQGIDTLEVEGAQKQDKNCQSATFNSLRIINNYRNEYDVM